MASGKGPTRAEFEELKAAHRDLVRWTRELRETTQALRRELQTQFTRIAEMQAILDEEHKSNLPKTPNPLTLQNVDATRIAERRTVRREHDH